MAREVHTRENLLRDATALTPRAQFRCPIDSVVIELFVGFRGSAPSFYFGEDPVYQFNSSGELRRAFVADEIIKAEKGKLIALPRQRTANQVEMVRRELIGQAQQALLDRLQEHLHQVRSALELGTLEILGQVPEEGNILQPLQEWLGSFDEPKIAVSPRAS